VSATEAVGWSIIILGLAGGAVSLICLWWPRHGLPRETRPVAPMPRGGRRCEHPEHFCGAALEPGDDETLVDIEDHLGPAWLRRMDRIARRSR